MGVQRPPKLPLGPLGKPLWPSHGSKVGKPKLGFSPKMSGSMSSHRISMLYVGVAGVWRSYGLHTLILGSFLPIFENGKSQKRPFLDFWQPSPPQKHIFSIPPFWRFGTPMGPNKTPHDRVRNNNTIRGCDPWITLEVFGRTVHLIGMWFTFFILIKFC